MGKMGRPKVENPINIREGVRLDAKTHERLLKYCRECGITKGEAIRKGVLLLLGEKNTDSGATVTK